MLEEIDRRLYTARFVSYTSEVLYDIDEEWKDVAFSHHSEKLAIAFGLISTKAGWQNDSNCKEYSCFWKLPFSHKADIQDF